MTEPVRGFPRGEMSTTVEISNHLTMDAHLTADYNTKDWRVVWHEGSYWIEVDHSTAAHDFFKSMVVCTQRYPVLDEHHFADLQYAEMLKAIARIAERSGTIIVSSDDAYDYLLDSQVHIDEDKPHHYTVMLPDEEFKSLIEEEFPHWREY